MNTRTKVLVIRFSSIGDVVLTTPVLRCLKNIPDRNIEVHYVTKNTYEEVLQENPYIDRLHLLDGNLVQLMLRLRKEKFDYIVDLQNSIRSVVMKLVLLRPSSGLNKANVRKWMMTNFKINRLPPVHIVDRYLATARALGAKNDGKGLDFFLSQSSESVLEILPESFQPEFIGFAIGGQHATKRLPNEKIISIINRLPLPVVLLGGEADKENAALIAAECDQPVFNTCGLLSLHESARLVKTAKVLITHDTGLMHIAAAFNSYIVSVWGNTIPAFGMYPYMPEFPERFCVVEVKDLACRPCSKLGYKKCPKGHFKCMMEVNEVEIVRAVQRMMLQQAEESGS